MLFNLDIKINLLIYCLYRLCVRIYKSDVVRDFFYSKQTNFEFTYYIFLMECDIIISE